MPALPEHLRPLLTSQPYPHPVGAVRLVETHVSWLFLTGGYAYKVKRPVHYPFVDLRSLERRMFYCEEELRLGRRFAPQLYLEVCRVTTQDGFTHIGGDGAVVEHAVRMRQFNVEDGLDRLLAGGDIQAHELEQFGRDLASVQARLPVAQPSQPWGSPAMVRRQLLENIAQCLQCFAPLGTRDELRALRAPFVALLPPLEPLLALRQQQGRVRECHGDLHAGNVVRCQGRLLAFDCMEFEPAFRWIDVAEDLAFLLMDLQARGAPLHAHALLSGFLAQCGDYAACRLLRLHSIHRALVRAKVAAVEAAGTADVAARAAASALHRMYLDEVHRLLDARRPALLLMHGVSGSGKSWLAKGLAPLLDAVLLRSDVERKRLAGLGEFEQSGSAPGQHLYSPQSNARLLEWLLQCAGDALAGGCSVIVDATFVRAADRARFRQLAQAQKVELRLIHCNAPHEVLQSRIRARQRGGGDASEADLAVLAWQQAHAEAIAPGECLPVIDADTTRADILAEVRAALRPLSPPG
jgi:aminoglycoside phosphotransferase family enzyme/predicted kinase